MFASWTDWQFPHARRIWASTYPVGAILALLLGAGAWSALIGVVVASAVIWPLEVWTRFRHEPPIRNDLSRYP
ncbi:hypothetical protein OJ998_22785 [Solirubrobacter taibaiensis]|nr:hypothetical protein [Solirubrobacter taibaiensis]